MKKIMMVFVLSGFLFNFSGLALAGDACCPQGANPGTAQSAPTKEWVLQKRHDRLERKIAQAKERREKLVADKASQEKLAKIDARISKLQTSLDEVNAKLATPQQ
ncbi:MAG: hypothetical protein HZC17_04205 [Candidatus Omnitrophica bacterium]|nr:hypothetical protein [Candidatus Omnitrophota bacterium]